MKRILSMLLVLVLTVTLLPLRAEAKTGGKLVALTFDDGPSSKYTAQLLDGLKERGVKVTFFMLGEMASYNPKLVKRAYEEGHEIACHSWSHPDLTTLKESEIKKELNDTFQELDKACGTGADYLLRPPYGATNSKVLNTVNVPIVNWSMDSLDWSLRNEKKVREKIVDEVYDGCIILCHDIHKTTIPAALGAIDDLMKEGYEFVTVSELYRRRGRELTLHKVHYNSKNNGVDCGPIEAPVITVSGDTKGINTVTITNSDKNVPLYYTVNGSYPNQNATLYTGPFKVPQGTTVTAVAAYKLNGSRSPLTVKKADAIQIVAPTITLDSTGAVVMTTPTVDSKIRYTVDGSKPGSKSNLYTGPEYLEGGCLLRAVTVHDQGMSAETKAYLSREGNLYYDIQAGDWFYEAMDWAFREGILNGIAPYTMDPDGTVTRSVLVTLLYRFSGDTLETGWERTNTFADVDRREFYAEAIEWASRNHIVEGYSKTAFGPNDAVTRQQMCKILASYLQWEGMPLADGEPCADGFADYDRIADWALESVENMVRAGLIRGDGEKLNPEDSASRAQIFVLLRRVADYMEAYVPPVPEVPEDPFEPSEPEDPEVPSEPTEPEEPEVPSEPSVPVEPEVPSEPSVPVEPEVPSEPSEPAEPEIPSEPSEPTEPEEPEDPAEPSEPEHIHEWKLNKALPGSDTEGDVSIRAGESFRLYIICKGIGCKETAPVSWSASTEGVVSIVGDRITGVKSGYRTWLTAEWEGETFRCIVRVRKDN